MRGGAEIQGRIYGRNDPYIMEETKIDNPF